MTFRCRLLRAARPCGQNCGFHNQQKNVKILKRIEIIPRRVVTEIQRLRAKFELKKPYFHPTCHYCNRSRFGGLEYEETTRIGAWDGKSPNLRSNPLTQARCDGSRNSQYAYVPNGSFLNSFLFSHFYSFFPFRCPLPWPENPESNRQVMQNQQSWAALWVSSLTREYPRIYFGVIRTLWWHLCSKFHKTTWNR